MFGLVYVLQLLKIIVKHTTGPFTATQLQSQMSTKENRDMISCHFASKAG